MVCVPKKQGGIGVLNIRTQNEALILKFWHKFFNKLDIPWVHLAWEKHYSNGRIPNQVKKGSFWWRDVLKLLDKFKGISVVNINDGRTCSLWEDIWNNIFQLKLIPIYFFSQKKPFISVQHADKWLTLNSYFIY